MIDALEDRLQYIFQYYNDTFAAQGVSSERLKGCLTMRVSIPFE
jgi:hypothetical protein